MICPYCTAQIPDGTKFCENCGSALLADAPIASPVEPAAADPFAQPAVQPATQSAQNTYQQPAYGAPAQQQPYAGQPYGQAAPIPPAQQYGGAQQPSAVPFVLAIIALVCAILGLFPVSIILAIVALVMNSGQKKRGELSSKQTPTLVMSIISLVLSVLVAITVFVLGAAVVTVIQNGEAGDIDEFIEEVISSQTTGGTGAITIGHGVTDATTASYVGTWEIDSMYTDGEEIASEDIELMQSMGLNVTLVLNADGSASLVMFGEEMGDGTWEDLGGGSLSLEFAGETVPLAYDGTLLTLSDGGDWIAFRKA